MPSVKDAPEKLRPYLFHGLELSISSKEANGECPFCGRSKFSVNIATGLAKCWSCPELTDKTDKGGINCHSFVELFWQHCDKEDIDYTPIVKERGLLPETLMQWGLVRSTITNEWLVPGYNVQGKVAQLYKLVTIEGKKRLLPTPTISHKIYGASLFDRSKEIVFICEGVWDGMALWETLGGFKELTEKDNESPLVTLLSVKDKAKNLLSYCNVLATPGCEVFNESWSILFSGKHVNIMFDNDHPKKNPTTGKISSMSAATLGIKRIAEKLTSGSGTPKSIGYLTWNKYDETKVGTVNNSHFNKSLPSGYDVRDHLMWDTHASTTNGSVKPLKTSRLVLPSNSKVVNSPVNQSTHVIPKLRPLASRLAGLSSLLGMVSPTPNGWTSGSARAITNNGNLGSLVKALPCTEYRTLTVAWRKALKWTYGLDSALTVMLSSITSTKSIGDQLWVKIVGPAGCGKTTLCEAISVASEYVVAKSTIRGFHSGYKSDGGGNEDNSLISKLYGKTLVTKDGDTLLQSPNLGQILSEARDIYDSTSRTHYRNKMSKDYSGIRMTWILCGTSSLRAIDVSELGERFITCIIMDGIDDDYEDEVLGRVAYRTDRNMGLESNSDGSTTSHPELLTAMQLTGGYIEYLKENASDLLQGVKASEEALHRCVRLGKFVACMRARPSKKQEETAEREFAARLVSQIVRLAKCLAVVMNKSSLDDEVMGRVRKVSVDTSHGQVLDLMKEMYRIGIEGAGYTSLALYTGYENMAVKKLLNFLRRIKIVERYKSSGRSITGQYKWRMTRNMYKLYKEIMEPPKDRAYQSQTF